MIPNQIGLDGNVVPPAYVAAVPARVNISDPRVVFDRLGVKIEKRLHRFYGPEIQITVKLPWPRRRFYDPSWDTFPMGRPALFVAFGRVMCSTSGWHARGAIIHITDEQPEYVTLEPIGYKNPINLANYDR